jgi:hypothetical protein
MLILKCALKHRSADDYDVSIITCPVCGSGMRPRTVVPEEYHRQRMTFVCECGFDYCQSSAVAIERTL